MMNAEPIREAPRRPERVTKEQPSPAQLQQRADDEMRSLRELFAKSESELGEAHPELEKLKQEAEAAHAEFEKALQEAEQPAEAEPFDESEHFGRVMDTLSQSPVNFSELESLRAEGIANQEKSRVTKEALVNRLGERYGEKMLNPEYTRSLGQLQEFLESRIEGMEDVLLCDPYQLTAENLIAIHETLGSPEDIKSLVLALDLKREVPELEYQEGNAVIQPAMANFDLKSGELDADITLALRYGNEDSYIVRGFQHKPVEQKDGTVTAARSVKHDVFRIQPELGNRGIAKNVLKNSLDWYLQQNEKHPDKPIAEVKLEANINVGGYAWASYGFGWDEAEMSSEKIKNYIDSAKQRFEKIASHVRSEGATAEEEQGLEAMLAAYEQAKDNPDITPQELAIIGANGPRFRQDSSGNWYTERQFAAAEREASEEFPTAIHAGKYGMLGEGKEHRWQGKVELTTTGKQGGKNLELLKKRIA